MSTIPFELNDYEASNLLCLLDALWNSHERGHHELQDFYSGDWVGDVPRKLAAAMLVGGSRFLDHEPNVIFSEKEMPTTREMVARCGVGTMCPHCGCKITKND